MKKCLFFLVFLSFSSLIAGFSLEKYVDQQQLVAHIAKNSDPSSWMMKRIQSDLSLFGREMFDKQHYSSALDPETLSRSFQCEIKQNLLYITKEVSYQKVRQESVCKAIQYLASTLGLPDLSVCISISDEENSHEAPVCCFAKKREARALLIPDFEALGRDDLRAKKQALKGSEKYPWKSKKNKMFWRGSTTGGFYQLDNWHLFPRGKIVLLSKQFPEFIDAVFTAVCDADKLLAVMLRKQGYYKEKVPVQESIAYKYLIDIDGNSCTYSRNYWILSCNSALFKQQTENMQWYTENMQWYYDLLIPWTHYVPVAGDLSDLLEKIKWAKDHDQQLHAIAQNGVFLAEKELTLEANLAYLYLFLRELSQKQEV